MGKRERRVFTDEFKRESVRLVETSGLTIKQIASDLGIGLSTLRVGKECIGMRNYYRARMMMLKWNWPVFARKMSFCVRNVIY